MVREWWLQTPGMRVQLFRISWGRSAFRFRWWRLIAPEDRLPQGRVPLAGEDLLVVHRLNQARGRILRFGLSGLEQGAKSNGPVHFAKAYSGRRGRRWNLFRGHLLAPFRDPG